MDEHIAEDELIQALDGELDAGRAKRIDRHLSRCWECRSRKVRLEQGIAEYMQVHRAMPTGHVVPSSGPLAKLRAQLRLEAPNTKTQALSWITASALALLAPLAIFFWFTGPKAEAAGPLPDSRLTPGAVRLISKQKVCVVPPEDEGRMVPSELALHVFEQYRIAHPEPRQYEVDYLISPALGGATAVQNLWPVPYAKGVWTSRVKDALEDHMRTLVCEGNLDLGAAQRDLATNWIAAYRRYFQTDKPRAAHAVFVKDSPWE